MEDPIFNGAFDNATGTAGLVELARAFAALPERPARSLLFMAVTAEEQGLLGSAYYAANPVHPTASTVAAINIDGVNVDGPMNDITVVGMGASELDDYLNEAASRVGRTLRPDPEPEKGFYYRSDHFSFAKVGIPLALHRFRGSTTSNTARNGRWRVAPTTPATAITSRPTSSILRGI